MISLKVIDAILKGVEFSVQLWRGEGRVRFGRRTREDGRGKRVSGYQDIRLQDIRVSGYQDFEGGFSRDELTTPRGQVKGMKDGKMRSTPKGQAGFRDL